MDAVEFLKTLRRMCNAECRKCEFREVHRVNGGCSTWRKTHPEEAVAIVEQWAAEHPAKTRQSEFLKQWPEALSREGILQICPASVSHGFRGKIGECVVEPKDCQKCKRQFWLEEVEE